MQTLCKRATVVASICAAAAIAGCGSSASSRSNSTGAAKPAASTTPAGAAPTGSPIVIGDLSDQTGPLGAQDAAWGDGFAVWAKWTNAHGGIAGHKVVVLARDTQSNVTTLLTETKGLLADKSVVAIVPGAAQGVDISKLLLSAKIPAVGGIGDDPTWFTNPNVFPVGTTPNALTDAIAALGIGKAGKGAKAADFYCAEAPTCKATLPLFEASVKAAGGTLAYQAEISGTAPNYTAQCVAAQQAGVKVLWIADVSAVIQRVAAGCAQNNFKPTYVQPDYASSYASVPALHGLAVASPVATPSSPAAATFRQAVAQYDPGMLTQLSSPTFALQAWASGQMIAAAIEAAKPSGAVTAADIYAGLYAMKNETLGGLVPPLSYTKDKPTSVPCYFGATVTNGTLKQDSATAACPAA